MVVIAVIAILTGILVTVISDIVERSRVSRACAEFRSWRSLIIRFYGDVGFFPREVPANTDPGFLTRFLFPPELTRRWDGPYMTSWPGLTPWGGFWDYDYGDFKGFDLDLRPGNEVAISQVQGPSGSNLSKGSAEAIDATLDSASGPLAGEVQWALDAQNQVTRLAVYIAEGSSW